ncbi:hypothetical protein PISMIDRAFT_281521 [Pisolithus microcarpus 441]|uniref:Uncharacterized protein n=1 Tax=Pisolithus microcarpus 441 TaxID=765257 RepID=A0A0C9XU59_9AGAM|nr:hypothetical protein PISMIDRAFT_281521 [Pisolithus microcarpus 441]
MNVPRLTNVVQKLLLVLGHPGENTDKNNIICRLRYFSHRGLWLRSKRSSIPQLIPQGPETHRAVKDEGFFIIARSGMWIAGHQFKPCTGVVTCEL